MAIKGGELREKEDYQRLILDYLCGDNGNGFIERKAVNYVSQFAMDIELLIKFLEKTQSDKVATLRKIYGEESDKVIVTQINAEILRKTRGLIDVIKSGVDFDANIHLDLYYSKPATKLNQTQNELFTQNIFSVMEEVYHKDGERIDLVLFLNGLAIIAIELKCNSSGQNYEDAIKQFKYERDPNTRLLKPEVGVIACFAMDTREAYMCAEPKGKSSHFRPFNKGNNFGTGNPDNEGIPIDYMWKEIFTKDKLSFIIEKFACVVTEIKKNKETGREDRKRKPLFPRYHQLHCIEKIVDHVKINKTFCNYLIQHSAGSGKTNTISWLAHILKSVHDDNDNVIFNSILIVTDRIVVDRQLQDAVQSIKHRAGEIKVLNDTCHAKDLADALNGNTKIVVTTIHKFFHILGKGLLQQDKHKTFAVLIDEAHSSTEGTLMEAVTAILADETLVEEEITTEDLIRDEITKVGKQVNVSMFAFTATPKPETIALFGTRNTEGKKVAFDLYSMKQAIQEGYILNVLENYVTWQTYYKINKAIEDDPELKSVIAKKKISRFVDLHETNIAQKTEIIIEHFRTNIRKMLDGTAKAMVVTSGRQQAVRYYKAFRNYIDSKGYHDIVPLVAFSGQVKDDDLLFSETSINKISEEKLRDEFDKNIYSVLIVANKYQTGFDQPKLCAMYVDKKLNGITAVQTLSRLNRVCPGYEKHTFILDFKNDFETIKNAFQPYYLDTILEASFSRSDMGEFVRKLEEYNFHNADDIDAFNEFLYKDKRTNTDKEKMWGLLNKTLNVVYSKEIKQQLEIRVNIRGFLTAYQFLIQTTSFEDVNLHKLYNFLSYLIKEIEVKGGNDFDIADKITVSNFTQVENTKYDGEISSKPEIKVKKNPVTIIEQQKKLLSQIIEEMNALYGKDYESESTIKSMLQIKDLLLTDESLKKSAIANTKDDFKYPFDTQVEKALIRGYEQNQDFYSTLLDNGELRQKIAGVFLDEVYNILKGNK